ncbi:multidrug transporter [alpha proteobacterium AAP81b]|nr:multidrug transporter [alpha proteobacterium AAP81b]
MTTAPPPRPPRFDPRLVLSFLVITLIWGSTWLVIKSQLGVVPPSWSVAYRFLIGGGAMLLLCLTTGRSLRIGSRGHGFALAVAVTQFVLNFNLVYRAEAHVTSGLVALCFALLLVPNALFAWVFLGQAIRPGFALGAAIGIGGLAILFAPDLFAATAAAADLARGIGLTLAAVLSASIANVLQATPLARRLPTEGTLAWAMMWGGLIDAGFAWTTAGPPVFDPGLTYVVGLLWLALAASALAFSLYYAIIRAVGPGVAAYSSVVLPLVAMTLSTLFEGYHWTATGILGGTATLIGLLVALRSR